ncbi:MAG: response regulator [Verrucomicrobia bacterium]|nr:response regulator [Verrucomicrobiota bacterium]
MLRDTLSRARILIVDDESANICLLERTLELIGAVNVRSTTDSQAAPGLFRDFRPDLVLLDLHMPAPDGFALLEQFGASASDEIGASVAVPVVVLTADVNPKTKHRALLLGAADFLTKPIDGSEVVLRIRNLLENRFLQLALRGDSDRLTAQVQERTAQLEDTLIQLRQAQQAAIRHERLSALGTMAAGIAHDFNNALTLIHGYSELLLGQLAPGKSEPSSGDGNGNDNGAAAASSSAPAPAVARESMEAKFVRTIMMAARDAARTVSRLRAFYRSDDKEETRVAVNLNQLVEQAVTLTSPRWLDETQARGLRIVIKPELGTLPSISGDPAELREMLTNLIFNAVDALPQGGCITLRTFVENASDADAGHATAGRVCLEVRDDGVGMDETVRRRCLEPFFTTKGECGTGLGLSGVYGIVGRHGGSLDIESAPGRGTAFRIVLPTDEQLAEASSETARQVGRTLRILVVDDQRIVCDLLQEQLQGDGHTVQTAQGGAEGLKKFLSEPFDLLLTDQAMPGMNGESLAAAAKEHAPEVPVILLTGFGDYLQAIRKTQLSDVDLVLHKPVTLQDLRRAILHTITQADHRENPQLRTDKCPATAAAA